MEKEVWCGRFTWPTGEVDVADWSRGSATMLSTWHGIVYFLRKWRKSEHFSSKVLCFPGWSWMWILRKCLLGLFKEISDREKVRREDLCVPLSKGSVCRYNFTAGNLLLSRGRDCKVGFVRGERMAMICS